MLHSLSTSIPWLLAQNDPDAAGALLFGGGCVLISVLLGVLGLAVWLWALVDAIRNPVLDSNTRLIWVIVIVLTNWIGALLYLIIGRKGSPASRQWSFITLRAMLYRLHFCADPAEPMPPVDALAAVDAADPMSAAETALASGLVPQDRLYRWCRVVLSQENGHAKQVLRVPINAELGPALE